MAAHARWAAMAPSPARPQAGRRAHSPILEVGEFDLTGVVGGQNDVAAQLSASGSRR